MKKEPIGTIFYGIDRDTKGLEWRIVSETLAVCILDINKCGLLHQTTRYGFGNFNASHWGKIPPKEDLFERLYLTLKG